MLSDFFHLNDETAALAVPDESSFNGMFAHCNELVHAVVGPFSFSPRTKLFKDKRFVNVKFSHCKFSETTFTNCHFEDCILSGCSFQDTEFHGSRFVNCNLYKSDFRDVYLDSKYLYFDRSLKRRYSNVMLWVYQALYANYENAHQWKFSMSADIKRRRWDRYQISYRIRTWKPASGREFLGSIYEQVTTIKSYMTNLLYSITVGYGYRPLRFLLISFVSVLAISYYVDMNWASFGFDQKESSGFPQSLFYVTTVLSTLGYSHYVPTTPWGFYFSSVLGLMGVAWTGIFIALLIRRFVR